MKIIVFSDSHGDVENMILAVEQERPDMALHLGDGWRDALSLRRRYPDLPLAQVPGNCDFRGSEAAVRVLEAEGRRILLCHGHTLGVKTGQDLLLAEALERGADAALFGHTHQPYVEYRSGVWLFNPGSIGDFRHPSYGTLLIEDGKFYPSLWTLD